MDAFLKDGMLLIFKLDPRWTSSSKMDAPSGQSLPTVTHISGLHSDNSSYIETLLKMEVSLMALTVQPTRRLS